MSAKPAPEPQVPSARVPNRRDVVPKREGTRKGPRGFGVMRDMPLNIDPRIDLTEPIYAQVLALEEEDKLASEPG